MNVVDAGDLRKVIAKVCDLDIMKRTRERKYVDARMMFCYILLKEGATLTGLAEYLSMHHASVHHYRNRLPWVVKSDAVFREKYEHVLSIYTPNPTTPDVYFFSTTKLIKEVLRLRKESQELFLKNEKLMDSMSAVTRREDRLAPIYRVIQERTPNGRELSFAHKLTQFYNGQA